MDKFLHKNLSSLSQGEIDELFSRWHEDRDAGARERLVEHYLPMANRLARRYWSANEPMGDLRQVAALGLIKAINGYDTNRPNGFRSYAVPTILGELRRYFRDCGWSVHVPRGLQELAIKVDQARRELDLKHASVTVSMIAEYLELPIEDVSEALAANQAHFATSLEAPSDSDEEGQALTLGNTLGTIDTAFSHAEIGADVARAARVLNERDRQVLELRFGSDLTQAEIAARLSISQMHVSRILRRSLDRLAAELDQPAGDTSAGDLPATS
jgi:RNA polymerase sigma-B factor